MMFWAVFLVIFLVLLAAFSLYLSIAYAKNLWPYRKPAPKNGKGLSSFDTTTASVGSVIMIIFVGILIVAIMAAGIYVTVLRYKIAGYAIKSGNTGVAVAALSPEIGSGISNLLGGGY